MSDKKPQGNLGKIILAVVVLAFVGITGWYQFRHAGQQQSAANPTTLPPVKIGGPFTLTADTGETVTDADFKGQYMLMFFGYTFCPDVCPTELATIADTMDILGKDGENVQPIFVSVDPARDTPEHLGEYVDMFHPKLIGLTGTEDQVAEVAGAYRVYYAKAGGPEAEADGSYLMDHSALTYLVGPDGELLTTFSYGTPPEKMAEGVRKFLE